MLIGLFGPIIFQRPPVLERCRSMPSLAIDVTVGQLVAERPSRSRVFQKLGIDFCCGGKLTVEEAARRRNLDPQTVLAVLLAAEEATPAASSDPDPAQLDLAALCDHIEQTHHAYLKTELPRLHGMLMKVDRAHGDRCPWMREALAVYTPFAEELWE